MTRRLPRSMMLTILLAAAAVPTWAQGQPEGLPERVSLELPKERIVGLPGAIAGAKVSPDGRIWYQLAGSRNADLDEIQDRVEREWDQAMPQIPGLPVVHFQKTPEGKVGRVWLAGTTKAGGQGVRAVMLGFDGKKWAEYVSPDPMYTAIQAVQVGEAMLFSSNGQVIVYDPSSGANKGWSSKDFRDKKAYLPPPRIVPEADGRGAIVVTSRPSGGAALWRYREGKWTNFALGDATSRLGVVSLVAGAEGAWVLANPFGAAYGAASQPGNVLMFAPYDKIAPEEVPISKLLEELKDPKTADKAEEALTSYGPSIVTALDAAIRGAGDADYKARLTKLRTNAYVQRSGEVRVPGGVDKAGDFGISMVTSLVGFSDGRGLLAGRIGDSETGRSRMGYLLMDQSGKWSRLAGEELKVATGSASNVAMNRQEARPGGLVVADGKRVWIDGGAQGPMLLDLAKPEVVMRLPWLAHASLEAVLPDGRLLARVSGSVVMVDPAAPDTRPVLPYVADWPGTTMEYVMADDGRLFAIGEQGAVVAFDGKVWSPAAGKSGVKLQGSFALGKGGAVVAAVAGGYTLVVKDQAYQADTLTGLIEKHHKMVAEAFAGARAARPGVGTMYLHADPAGNVFVLAGRDTLPQVYIPSKEQGPEAGKGRWADAGAVLRKAGGARGHVTALLPVGDGSGALVVDDRPTYGPEASSVMLRVVDGELQVTKVPLLAIETFFGPNPVAYDQAGGLWARAHEPAGGNAFYMIPMRFTLQGVQEKFRDQTLVFSDRDNNVWLRGGKGHPGANGEMQLWRDGVSTPGPSFAGAAITPVAMSADKAGSIWAVGAAGLVHLAGSGPGNTQVVVDKTYQIEGTDARPMVIEASPLGFMLAVSPANEPGRGYNLRLVGLPK